ncbi:MAG: permease, partial [Candidatus Micrarchaeota archaeon]
MMDPFQLVADWLVFGALGLEGGTQAGEAAHFFVYDSIKIIVLLFLMIFVMGIIRTYLSRERVHGLIGDSRYGLGNLLASLFG